MDIQTLYQELIIDHGTEPRNCRRLDNAQCSAQGFNPLCGDKISLFLNLDNNRITEVTFEGTGCAISMASTSLMTEALIGKTLEEASQLFDSFQILLTKDQEPDATLGKLVALAGVKAFPARVKCATLGWHTLQAALKKEQKPISTEIDIMEEIG